MAKKVMGYLKLQVKAGSATPSPPIGPALGQRGINIMEFCKAFNAQTQEMEKGSPVPVVITYYQDKSFTFVMKTAPVSFFLKKAAGLDKTRLQKRLQGFVLHFFDAGVDQFHHFRGGIGRHRGQKGKIQMTMFVKKVKKDF